MDRIKSLRSTLIANISQRFARDMDNVLIDSCDASFRNCTRLSIRQNTGGRRVKNKHEHWQASSSSLLIAWFCSALYFSVNGLEERQLPCVKLRIRQNIHLTMVYVESGA
jgi:hypothetical protein